MVTYTNFYETQKEASMRLTGTVVLYDGEPYYVLLISDHKADGIFRVYLDKLGTKNGMAHINIPVPYHNHPDPKFNGDSMDEWLEKNPDKGIIRKMMNSPKFNKFRPFPLGMMNCEGNVVYAERRPNRSTQQGLTDTMIKSNVVSLVNTGKIPYGIGATSVPLYHTIMGNYPTPLECIKNLTDKKNANQGAAFNREFAFLAGPAETLFLAYKSDVVGVLPEGDLSAVKLANKYKYVKEAVADLNLFETIK